MTATTLDARLATGQLLARVTEARPLCHAIAAQNGITPHQLMALDSAVAAVRWIFADYDAQHDPGLPMPRCVAGLIDFWSSVNRLIARTTKDPAPATEDEP
jgi:hypothetical protein